MDYLQQAFNRALYLKYHAVTSSEISRIIKSLIIQNSHGCDEISIKVLKISSPFIISPLTYISNKMLSSGNFSR
jgi:hypothetical protein